jgi:Tol biopolymer transport system component
MKLAALKCGFVAVLLSGACLATFAQDAAGKRPITFDDLRSMHRVASPIISPDGKWIAYAMATPDMDANRNASNIWIVPASGGAAIQLTQSGHDSAPMWSPDSKALAFISSREGNSQVYVLSMEGGESHAITHVAGGADLVKWSPDGSTIAFTSPVYVDCKDDACNSARDADKEKSKVKARVYEQLLYRHWTHWSEGKRSHLFVAPADGSGTPRDLTAGANYDVPPDERGKEICYTAVPDKVEALSTNGELFVVPVSGGEGKKITTNPGFDGNPVYSPDGNYIAYHAQLTPGYEADRWRVMRYDRHTEKSEDLTEKFDRSAEGLVWSPDSKTIYFTAENETLSPIYAVDTRGGAAPKRVVAKGFNTTVSISGDGKMAYERTSLTMPAELFVTAGEGENAKQVTHHNDALLAKLDMNAPETFWFEGAGGSRVQAMLVRPPTFSATNDVVERLGLPME